MNALASSQPQLYKLLYTRTNLLAICSPSHAVPHLLKLNTEHEIMRENYFFIFVKIQYIHVLLQRIHFFAIIKIAAAFVEIYKIHINLFI